MGINNKNAEVSQIKDNINSQIDSMKKDENKIKQKTSEYNTLTDNLKRIKSDINTKNSLKNMIPTLLSQVMNIIPKEVQLISIENTSDKHIIITAQSTKYEQLAYFKTLLKSNNVLSSVVSTEAKKNGNTVTTTIEGEVPWKI